MLMKKNELQIVAFLALLILCGGLALGAGSISLTLDKDKIEKKEPGGVTVTCTQTPDATIGTLAANTTNISIYTPALSYVWSTNEQDGSLSYNFDAEYFEWDGEYTVTCFALAKNATWNETQGRTFENTTDIITVSTHDTQQQVEDLEDASKATTNQKIGLLMLVVAVIATMGIAAQSSSKKKRK